MEIWEAILSVAAVASLCNGIFTIVQMALRRRWEKSEKGSVQVKALRYIMLWILIQMAKEHITEGEITMDDRRQMHKWHEVYHDGLGGNGDMDNLMAKVDKLPLRLED